MEQWEIPHLRSYFFLSLWCRKVSCQKFVTCQKDPEFAFWSSPRWTTGHWFKGRGHWHERAPQHFSCPAWGPKPLKPAMSRWTCGLWSRIAGFNTLSNVGWGLPICLCQGPLSSSDPGVAPSWFKGGGGATEFLPSRETARYYENGRISESGRSQFPRAGQEGSTPFSLLGSKEISDTGPGWPLHSINNPLIPR